MPHPIGAHRGPGMATYGYCTLNHGHAEPRRHNTSGLPSQLCGQRHLLVGLHVATASLNTHADLTPSSSARVQSILESEYAHPLSSHFPFI